jgi:hypothetical protein
VILVLARISAYRAELGGSYTIKLQAQGQIASRACGPIELLIALGG